MRYYGNPIARALIELNNDVTIMRSRMRILNWIFKIILEENF